MLYNASAGAVELSICCITAGARLHSENEMFNDIMQSAIRSTLSLPLIK